MKKEYDDTLLPQNFEEMARAYSRSLKDKGFVFIKLQDEEFSLLVGEIMVLFAKMRACLEKLSKLFDSKKLKMRLDEYETILQEKFPNKKPHTLTCVANENVAFLSLVSIENTLTLKLMSLSVKSGELELCNGIMAGIVGVFAESFETEGFICKD